ncbi:MAG: enoyl-CoA hydratase/isomerase family protein [Bacteroidales bacterium]|nr:enoyl-CoA hydratase/isomerase family protein [Bacteroidales bacterium]
MELENILYEVKGAVAHITINRPKQMNALNKATFVDLETVIDAVNADSNVRGAIITGSGEKSFIAGADIKEFAAFSVAEGEALSRNGMRIFAKIEQSLKPFVAAINGFALGGGLELAMSCHVRVAETHAKFGQPEVGLGVTPGYAGTQRLTQLVGKGKAIELLMSAEMIDAEQAFNYRLVNYITESGQSVAKAEEVLSKIAKQSPMAVAAVIRCVNDYYATGIDGFNTEAVEFGKCFGTEDFKEGTTAFMERRKAEFPGR